MSENLDEDLYRAAVYKGREDLVADLIEKGADTNWDENEGKWSSLHRAAWRGDLKITRRLVEAGAQIEKKSKTGRTPLLIAAFHGKMSVVRYLILKGANIKGKGYGLETPLFWSTFKGHERIVKHLLYCGAEPPDIRNIEN